MDDTNNIDNNITTDNLLQELQKINDLPSINAEKPVVSTPKKEIIDVKLDEDNINEFILKSAERLILDGLSTINNLKDVTSNTFDDKSMSAFADIVNATNNTIGILNDINIQKRKGKDAKEIKQMDIDAKQKQLGSGEKKTNIILTDRESLLKMIESDKNIEKQIMGESKLITNDGKNEENK